MIGVGRRRQALVGVVVLAVLSALVGFVAGRTIKSPADAAADAEVPEASLITVPVELRVLASNVVVRGDARLEGSVDVTVDGSAGLSTGGVAVVTSISASEGEVLSEGSVLIEVSERPVLVLAGELPMFRSLGPGSRGDDVSQLQEALARLGFATPVDGVYGEDTERAIELLYGSIGYSAPGLTDSERADLNAAREALDGAQSQLNASIRQLDELKAPLPRSTVLQANASLASAEAAVTIASASAAEALATADATIAALIVDRSAAQAASGLADDRLAEAQGGTHPDTGLAPTAQELTDLAAEAAAAAEARLAAEKAVTAGQAGRVLTETETQRTVNDAETQLEIARAQHEELLAPPNILSASEAVTDSRAVRDRAAAAQADLEARTGVRVPLAEVVFVRALPSRVQRLFVSRGDLVSGPVMTISGADVTIDSAIPTSDRSLVAEGMMATVDDQALGLSFDAEITTLADEPGGRATEGRYFMELTPVEDPGTDVAGLNLRITIPVTSTGGEVLTVPLAALAAGGDGSVRIEIEDDSGDVRTVTVTTGLETTGFVEITPVEGSVEPGDRVVIGVQ